MITQVMQFAEEHINFILALAGVSLFLFFASLIIGPLVIGRLRPDYFLKEKKREASSHGPVFHVLKITGMVLKNVFGLLLLAGGILMLFVPGQGLLTIIMGLCLLNFPGKRKLLKKLTSTRKIQQGLNWIRKKLRKEPFLFDGAGV